MVTVVSVADPLTAAAALDDRSPRTMRARGRAVLLHMRDMARLSAPALNVHLAHAFGPPFGGLDRVAVASDDGGRTLDGMEHRDSQDRPLSSRDPFNQEVRLLLAPRADPAKRPGPRGNPPLDPRAVARAARMLDRIVG